MKRITIFIILLVLPLALLPNDTIPSTPVANLGDTVPTVQTPDTVPLTTQADTIPQNGAKRSQRIDEQLTQKPAEVLEAISFPKIFWTLVLLAIGYFIIKTIIKLLELFAERSTKYRISIKSFIPIIRIVIWGIIIFAVVKGIFDPPFQTLIAISASITIAVGLAAQDLLKNILGGIMLLFDRPFQVGDKIEVGKHYGEVLEIGLRATRLVTPDDSVVTVPNLELMNSSVSNANSGELNCQVVAELFLPLHIDTQLVRKIATEAAQVSRFIYLNKPIVVEFTNVAVGPKILLKMRLKAYVMDIRYEFQFQSDMTEILIRELSEQGVELS